MPRRKKPVGNAEGNADNNFGLQEQGDTVGAATENPNFFEQLHPDDYVRIHRMDDFDKKWVLHGRLAMHEQNEEFVGRTLGGGTYRVQLLSKVDTGNNYEIKGTKTFKAPGRYIPPALLLGMGQEQPAPTGSAQQQPVVGTLSHGGNPMETLNSALIGSVINLLDKMQQPRNEGPRIDWGPIIAGGIEIAAAIITQKKDTIDPLTLLKEIREIVTPAVASSNAPASNAIADAVKGLRELMALKDTVDGKEPPLDPEAAMFNAVPRLIEVLAGKMPNRNPNPPQQQPQQQLATQNAPLWSKMLLAQRANILCAASMGMAPGLAAEVALQFLPKEAQGILDEFLAIPDHVELAMQTIPELRNFPHWTQDFFAEVVNLQSEDAEDHGEATDGGSGASD